MTRILLIRHGDTDLLGRVLYGRMPDVHLNPTGRTQAQRLARALSAQYRIAEVVSSPMERALETAKPIADAQRALLSIDEDFNELDFGLWLGKPFAELSELEGWKQYNERRSTTRPPDGESMMEVQARAWKSVQAAMGRHHARTQEAVIAMVTHGDVIRGLLMLLLGMPIDHIHRLEVAPASISEVSLGLRGPRVESINRTIED